MLSTSEVLDHHLKSVAEQDMEGVLADYAPDAVLSTPAGLLKGPDAMKPLVQALISEVGLSSVHVLLYADWPGREVLSAALLNQIRTVDRTRIVKRLGSAGAHAMEQVNEAIRISLALIEY
jgi:mRNA-degrading endonuclease toxin of MazEF toxin-antitoxin module